ncbi:hypothetical protein CMO88_03105 [Candidatus Woesearchaeota archaeon]|nr:hypothetical protein [Candidatus Woesearchaeota archaeon]
MEAVTKTKKSYRVKSFSENLLAIKIFLQKTEARLNEFEDSKKTALTAKNMAEKNKFTKVIKLLNAEIVDLGLQEHIHWTQAGNSNKALKAYLSAALALLSFQNQMHRNDFEVRKIKIFTKGIPLLWNAGTLNHRQGNANLVSGCKPYEVISYWDKAVNFYQTVQKLYAIGSSLGMKQNSKYYKQAQIQTKDLKIAMKQLGG